MARCYPKHHWMLESPNGRAKVGGVCKLCGARKKFVTGHQGQGWGGTPAIDPKSDKALYPDYNNMPSR
jgi:hypothetical protein